MNILIFGASSGIGRRLMEILYDEKNGRNEYNIIAVCRPDSPNNSPIEALANKRGKVIYIDACSENPDCDILDEIPPQDYCYVMAWNGSQRHLRDNAHINEASRHGLLKCLGKLISNDKIKKAVIYTGTQAEYGNTSGSIVTEETICTPKSAYGKEKYMFGQQAYELCNKKKIKFYEFRLHSVFGNYVNQGGVLHDLIFSLKENKTCRFNTPCNQKTDYLYVDDCVRALLTPICNDFQGGIYNISSGTCYTLRQYIEIVRNIVNPLCNVTFGSDVSDDFDFAYNSDKLRSMTGWEPEFSFEKGISLII